MAVVCIDLTQDPEKIEAVPHLLRALEADYDKYVGGFIGGALDNLRWRLEDGSLKLPAELTVLLKGSPVRLGRIGVRELTSAWALERYPKASHEIVITLTPESDVSHVILGYV